MDDASVDDTVMQALWATSLVYYGRCFGKGKLRTITSGLTERLTSGHEEMHQSILWRRDKQVAHAIESVFDDVTIAAGFVEEPPLGYRARSIAMTSHRNIAPDKEPTAIFYRHVLIVMERLGNVVREHQAELEKEVVSAVVNKQKIGRDVTERFAGEHPGKPQIGPLGGGLVIHRPGDEKTRRR
jgi:hypothetical protein